MDKIHAHFTRMQEMASRYLEPGPYHCRDGIRHINPMKQQTAFIHDIIWMLDGPEQRAAQSSTTEE